MASNYTTNYQLNQWEPTDQVQRTDFNADNAKIDAALKSQADSVSGLSGEIDGLAQSIAANTSALNGKGNCQLYHTTYSGSGVKSRSVTLPGSPLFVMVIGSNNCLWGIRGAPYGMSLHGLGNGNYISFSWSSQSVSWTLETNSPEYACNKSGTTYYLLALLQK